MTDAANQFDLTDDQRAIQETGAALHRRSRSLPFAAEWDEHHIFPRETIRPSRRARLRRRSMSPRRRAVSALGRLDAALIMEAMAYGCPSTSRLHLDSQHGDLDDRPLSARRRSQGRATCPTSIADASGSASYCLTEPGSGSDAAALKTKRGPRWRRLYRQRARRQFISGGGENEVYVVMVRTGRGWTQGHQLRSSSTRTCPASAFGAQGEASWAGARSRPRQVNVRRVFASPWPTCVGAEGEGFRIAMAGPRRRAAQHRRLFARRRAALPRRGAALHQASASSSATAIADFQGDPIHAWPTWRPSCRRRAHAALHRRRQGHLRARPTRPALRRWPSGFATDTGSSRGRSRAAAAWRLRLSAWIIRSSASGATSGSIRSWRAPTR